MFEALGDTLLIGAGVVDRAIKFFDVKVVVVPGIIIIVHLGVYPLRLPERFFVHR